MFSRTACLFRPILFVIALLFFVLPVGPGAPDADAQTVGAGRVPLFSSSDARRLERAARRARPSVRRRARSRRARSRRRASRVASVRRQNRVNRRKDRKRKRISKYLEREFSLDFPKGSVVIVNSERKLYYVTGKNRAIRYNVAVGNREELWTGVQVVTQKRKNPSWRSPNGGPTVRGGPSNPLGVRALYLGWTLWRIHGTPARGSIGRAVSNGCIRMLNEDVTDLYDRVHIGAPVYVFNKRADASRELEWGRKVAQKR